MILEENDIRTMMGRANINNETSDKFINRQKLLEAKSSLLYEVATRRVEINEVIENMLEGVASAEGQLSIFRDSAKAHEALYSTMEEYVGMNRGLWYDTDGSMKEEVRAKLDPLLGELGAAGKQLQQVAQSEKPIEAKLESVQGLLGMGTVGSLITALHGAFTGTAIVTGKFGIATGVAVGGVAAAKVALVLAVGFLLVYGVRFILKKGKSALEDIKVLGPVLKGAMDLGRTFLSGMKKFASWAKGKVKGGIEAYKARGDSGEEAEPAAAMQESLSLIKDLNEVLDFVNFCNGNNKQREKGLKHVLDLHRI